MFWTWHSSNLQSEKHPYLRFHVNGELSKNDHRFETNVEFQHRDPENKDVNSLKFFSVATKELKPFSHVYSYAISVQHPRKVRWWSFMWFVYRKINGTLIYKEPS